jgi:hypothetical protein
MILYEFLSGAVTFGFFVCCLFFMRFWRRTGDQLFIAFALAFGLLGLGEGLLTLIDFPAENRVAVFSIRLAAFGVIIFAIARKNRTTDS